jgi:hypothetical protein
MVDTERVVVFASRDTPVSQITEFMNVETMLVVRGETREVSADVS